MTTHAAAYLRRSAADDGNPGDISRPAQEEAIRLIAARDGYTGPLTVYSDWGRSGDEGKISRRTEYARMLAAVERGEVSVIYAYALDRLARSVATFGRLLAACKLRNVRVVTQREGDLSDTGNPNSWLMGSIVATFAEFELRTTKARNGAALAQRRARGDVMAAPYGKKLAKVDGRIVLVDDPEKPVAPLLAAYRRAGTVLGACKLLDAAGAPRPRHSDVWQPASLTAILAREGVLPRRGSRRHFARSAILAGLLRCHCGRTLTPDLVSRRATGYYCANGKRQGAPVHGTTYVPESRILPFVKAEIGHLDVPPDVGVSEAHEAERAALLERRRRLGVVFADGLMDDQEYRAELGRIATAIDDLGDAETFTTIPSFDWDAPAADLNDALRALLARVELDAAMQPVRAVWRVPRFRAD